MSDHQDPGTDLIQQAAAEVAPEVGVFIGTVFGSASFELDGMLGAHVNFWRLKRWIKVATKSQKMLADAGLTAEQVPFKTSVPLAEGASLEEDDDLVERWAGLLANAAGRAADVPPSFAGVLRDIEPEAATLLERLYAIHMSLAPSLRFDFWVDCSHPDTNFDLAEPRFQYHVDNLVRVGVVRLENHNIAPYSKVGLTEFGRRFVQACKPPGTPLPYIRWENREELQRMINARRVAEAEQGTAKRAEDNARTSTGA